MKPNQTALLEKQIIGRRSQNPLVNVWQWELRRIGSNRVNWALAGVTFLFLLGMMYWKHAWLMGGESSQTLVFYGTSSAGMLLEFVNVLLLVTALILPFLVTEGVARDQKQRIHEILMSTPLPSWAYVWGRFLAVVSMALGLAVLVLITQIGMGNLLHYQHPVYPAPVAVDVLTAWAVVIVPAFILITALGFTLGTLWPRRTMVIMLGMLIGWILLFTLGNILWENFGSLFMYLNPTSNGVLGSVIPQILHQVPVGLHSLAPIQQALITQQVQAHLPDLFPFLLAHYGLAACGMILVALVAVGFQRFRNVLN